MREILDYRFFDSLFIAQIATDVGLSEREIADFSEEDYKVKSFLERLMSFNPAEMVISPSRATNSAPVNLDDSKNIDLVKLTVRIAAEHGNMVIVGRGAQVILKNQPDVLHVRIVAPEETRLQRLQDIEGLSLTEARQRIEERDKAGLEYLQRFFGGSPDSPYLYHLIINTGLYDNEQAAQLIVAAVRQLAGAVPA